MFFENYELTRMSIESPTFSNAVIMAVIVAASAITVRKRDQGSTFMDSVQTTQLKGLAILLVIVGHLWVHVASERAFPLFGDYSVTIFLLLSGYGLTVSLQKMGLTNFFRTRLMRVFVPYWIITTLWLLLDMSLLHKSYSAQEIFLTYLGINLSDTLTHMDYVRWFVTLLIVWYFIFYACHKTMNLSTANASQIAAGLLLCFLNRLGFFPVGDFHQILAFPAGCTLAQLLPRIKPAMSHRSTFLLFVFSTLTLIGIEAILVLYKGYRGSAGGKLTLFILCNASPYFLFNTLTLSLALIGNCFSSFLLHCGDLSYEIFLLHGPLLVKYNFVFALFGSLGIVISFILFILITIGIATAFRSTLNGFYNVAYLK